MTLLSLSAPAQEPSAPAQEMPPLKPGMWQFSRNVDGRAIQTLTQCANPTADMREQDAMLTQAGCLFSLMRNDGKNYTFDTTCKIKSGSGELNSKTTSVLTIDGDSAYRVRVTGTYDGKPTDEVVVAQRTGDCPK